MLADVHRQHLERFRHSMNLVGPGDVGFHFRDCEAAVGWLAPEGRWADLGSGAGFPGLVLAARFPQLEVDLVESRRKRCVFLEGVVLAAGEGERVQVVNQRVEDLPDAGYHGLTARAFAAPDEVLRHAARLLVPGGTVVLFLQEGTGVPTAPGFQVFHVERYAVDGKARQAIGLRREQGSSGARAHA